MKKIFLSLAFLFVANALFAQATSSTKIGWDQPAPDLATANGYTYKYYPDLATTGINFSGVTCTGTATPFSCVVNIPAFTPGAHSLTLTASNIAGESPKSAALNFTFVVTPGTPLNPRLQ